ncbi:SDR family oxidoreductase [Phytomonospora sp. NPDC050363]|uniref:SDR family oxidoreductase n=1 Tax=Phytomonospora sp. NPDC050363 TaxID=3155642 RepID=UPI0033FEB02B
MRILVTGATGYVGGRLVPLLLDQGHDVRCLTRSPDRLRDIPWSPRVEVAVGDVATGKGIAEALDGIEVVYYLVHALGRRDFARVDRRSARNLAEAAEKAGVTRVVYLGGPVVHGPDVSAHLRSRGEVAEIFLNAEVPATVLRAAVIIGSGSASFEMLRHLTERLPVMVTPRWVSNRVQPIAIRDVLHYLAAAPGAFPAEVNRGFDIAGPDVLTYAQMMQRYARVAGLPPRVLLPVRALSPWLSSHWVGLVTPVPNAIARPLVGSLVHEAVASEHDIADYVPDPPGGLTGFDTAVRLALRRIAESTVETSWANASVLGAPAEPLPTDPSWSGRSVYTDVRRRAVNASPEALWDVIESVGGERGWYSFPLAWAVRGWLDRAVGGVGLRRGRRDPRRLRLGEALDFWRVEEIVPGELLRLRAEMRLPGRAWLEMRVRPHRDGSLYEQRAVFLPKGLAGHAYWASVVPFHAVVFGGMARNIGRAAERAK